MNNERRKKITAIIEKFEVAVNDLNLLKAEEQDAFDNLPESFKYCSKCEDMEFSIGCIDDSIDYIESSLSELKSVR